MANRPVTLIQWKKGKNKNISATQVNTVKQNPPTCLDKQCSMCVKFNTSHGMNIKVKSGIRFI